MSSEQFSELVRRAGQLQETVDAAGAGKPNPEARDITLEEIERRFTYHPPSGEAKDLHHDLRVAIKRLAKELAFILPASREKSLAFTALEEASYHAHAAIARDPSLHEPEADS